MNFGTNRPSAQFHLLAEKFALDGEDIEHCVIPSNTGDYKERLGQKKSPSYKGVRDHQGSLHSSCHQTSGCTIYSGDSNKRLEWMSSVGFWPNTY